MTRHATIWVVVADGSRARIVVPTEREATYATIRSFDSPDSRLAAHELGRASLGRSHESATAVRHSIEPRSDPHERMQVEFVREVAEALSTASAEGAFDRLVLVAPSRVAAVLCGALDEGARRKIVGELAKDLTRTPDHELGAHLEGVGLGH